MEGSEGRRYIQWGEQVPETVRVIIQQIPLVEREDMDDIVTSMETGHCATCGNELAENTMIVFGDDGIIAAYCQGVCATDMQVIGWLAEVHEDIIERIQFRGEDHDGHD